MSSTPKISLHGTLGMHCEWLLAHLHQLCTPKSQATRKPYWPDRSPYPQPYKGHTHTITCAYRVIKFFPLNIMLCMFRSFNARCNGLVESTNSTITCAYRVIRFSPLNICCACVQVSQLQEAMAWWSLQLFLKELAHKSRRKWS